MSVRLTRASNQYVVTADLVAPNYNSAYTFLLAYRPATVAAEEHDFMTLYGAVTDADVVYLDSADSKFKFYSLVAGVGTITVGSTVAVAGTWYYLAMVRHSATSVELFCGTSPNTMVSVTGGPQTVPTVAARGAIHFVKIGTFAEFNAMANGRFRYGRIFQTNLSLADIKTATGTKWSEWFLLDASTLTDTSGNARNLTAVNGPLTTEADDTVAWPQFVVQGQANYF